MSTAAAAPPAEGPPPSNHTIKPHHVHILRIIQVLFLLHQPEAYPPTFMLNVHRVLLVEMAEVRLVHLMYLRTSALTYWKYRFVKQRHAHN